MKVTRVLSLFFVLAALAGGLMSSCQPEAAPAGETSLEALSSPQLIARGKYLVDVAVCEDCHTPKVYGPKGPEFDPKRRLAGHPQDEPPAPVDPSMLKESSVVFNQHFTAITGPWGTSFAGNLTSDATGIGLWSEEQFFRSIRKGKLKGMENGRDLLPPMPWPNYAKFTDDDLRAVFAYLKSTEPVRNVVPQPLPPVAMK